MKNVYRYLLAAMLTITPPLVTAASNGLEEALSTALTQFDRATEGDKDALRSALQTFETRFSKVPNAFQAAVWLTRARVAQRQDHDVDYKLYLQRAVALDPGGKSGHLARSMLSQGD